MTKRLALTLLLVGSATGVVAQDGPTVYTYAAHWDVPRESWDAFTTDNGAEALLDRLVADGTLMWWSNVERFVHATEGTTHGTMFASTTRGGIERALEDLGKLPAGPNIPGIDHHDHFWVSLMHGGRSATETGGYLWMTVNEVAPGQGARWVELQEKYYEPVYRKLLEEGTILAYDISRAYVHAGNPRARFTFVVTPNAAADEKVDAALAAARQEHAPAIYALRDTEIRAEHRDVLFHIQKFAHK